MQLRNVARIHHRQVAANVNCMNYLISSIDLDKDDEFFATGGVEKKILVYDYGSILQERREMGGASVKVISSVLCPLLTI